MRRSLPILAFALLLAASTASARTTFNLSVKTDGYGGSPGPIGPLYPGDTLTLDIRLSGGRNVNGLSASVWGYDESVIDFVRGEAVSSINHAVAIPGVGAFAGLTNLLVPQPPPSPVTGTFGTGPLSESAVGANGSRVQFMNGVSVTATNSNALDPGLDGTVEDAQFRIVFEILRIGSFRLNVGTGYPGDGEIVPGEFDDSANTVLQYTIIPEPGNAVLLGLGLASLGSGHLRRARTAGAR